MSSASTVIADALYEPPAGIPTGVIVHVRDGAIAELEVYTFGKGPVELPAPHTLRLT
jgi:hypothetical protein